MHNELVLNLFMNTKLSDKEDWLFEITPKNKLLSLNLKEVWQLGYLISYKTN